MSKGKVVMVVHNGEEVGEASGVGEEREKEKYLYLSCSDNHDIC
jgi:hypothetical protein